MRFVIVTGMSGAGKSTALKMLEDAGYFCVDNLPIALMEKFAQFAVESVPDGIQISAAESRLMHWKRFWKIWQ